MRNKTTTPRLLVMFYKGVTRMTKFKKVLICIFFIQGITKSTGTLKEDCAEMLIEIERHLEVYNRVNSRSIENKLVLNNGFRNDTLKSEIVRDDAYLTLSYPLVLRMLEVKSTLDALAYERINLHVDVISDIIEQAKELLAKQATVFDRTLMQNFN
jgi:hypothetical protein